MSIRRPKVTINATVSPILKTQAEELVEKGEYSSVSDIVEAALTIFFHTRKTEYLIERKLEKVAKQEGNITAIEEGFGQSYRVVEEKEECTSKPPARNARTRTGTMYT